MAASKTNSASLIEREIVSTRVFGHSCGQVFDAFCKPERLVRWWGPYGFTDTVHEFDFRPGGLWRHTMHGPDQAQYPNQCRFVELVPDQRIQFEHLDPMHSFQMTMDMEPCGEGCRLTWRMVFESVELCNQVREVCERCNEENFDRLQEELERDTSDRDIMITRQFRASRDLVFQAWTDPEQLSKWWGPNGFRTTTHSMDFRPGGEWHYVMHSPDGTDYPNRIRYSQILPGHLLVYSHDDGEDVEDVSFETIVTFEELGEATNVIMRSVFPTTQERDRVAREYGAVEGGHQTLGRLAELVEPIAQG